VYYRALNARYHEGIVQDESSLAREDRAICILASNRRFSRE